MSELVGTRPALTEVSIVWRLFRRRDWKDPDTGDVLPDAYFRRPTEAGLSVGMEVACTLDEVIENSHMNKVHGVAALAAGSVWKLGLAIVPDDPSHATGTDYPFNRCHAEIMGVPLREAEGVKEAERLAGLLARASTLIEQT